MKHKLTVLACVGLALLLSTGFAFARDSGGLGVPNGMQQGQALPRCAIVPIPIFLNTTSATGGWGLPLTISGGATIQSATPGAALGGFSIGIGGFPGTAGVLNFVAPSMPGGCLPAGNYPAIWTLNVLTPSACTGSFVLDTAFFPPAGAYVYVDCNACPQPLDWFKGVFHFENKAPVCGTNTNETVHYTGSIAGKVLNATDPDACDNPLAYSPVSYGGLNATALVTPDGHFNYTASCADKVGSPHTVTFRATDQCQVSVDCSFTVTVTNTAPICGTNPPENVYFMTGVVNKTLHASDPDGDPIEFVRASKGTVTSAGIYNWATTCADVGTNTVTFWVRDVPTCDSVQCSFQVTVYQNAPVATDPPNFAKKWCDASFPVTLVATDDGCKLPLVWNLVSVVPASQNVPGILGNTLTFDPDCLDIGKGPMTVTVRVFDGEKDDLASFTVTVTNAAPVITCPANIPLVVSGNLVTATATATDVDLCDALTFSPTLFSAANFVRLSPGPGTPNNWPTMTTGGAFSWQTSNANPNDEGLWEATITVSDGCGGVDVCTFTILVKAELLIWIGDPTKPPCTMDAYVHTLNGLVVKTYVNLADGYLLELGGLNLLICYDQTGLTFLGAKAINDLAGWEYFTWRYSSQSNCQGGCPTGYLRIISIADLDNGPTHHPPTFYLNGAIIELSFQVTADRNFINQCLNVGFCSLECGDNSLSSKSGDTLYIAIGDELCDANPKPGKVIREVLHFCDSKICIDEPKDDRGDMNLNGMANEVGDAVLFTNYFIYGEGVFSSYCPPPGGGDCYKDIQILASDVNDDGVVLTVADLIYMIRIITGDAEPFPQGGAGHPKVSPYVNSATASYNVENGALHISTTSPVALAGAAFVFRYNGMAMGEPVLSAAASNMKVRSSAQNGELRVLVSPDLTKMASVNAGTNEIVSIPVAGEGTVELVAVQMSDASGALLSSNAAKVGPPKEYALLQNYPNPFNAGTVIGFNVTKATDWTLSVYNVAGQVVRTFAGSSDAGTVQVAWDGKDVSGNHVASGVYFYRVKADTFTATKKMTLLK